ncbi:MAG: metallophosphoesterase [Marinibacterium sp.]|nr:metallophosphoesterase [Marinibacterium sp.]
MTVFIHLTDLHIGDPALGIPAPGEIEIGDPRPMTDTSARLSMALEKIAAMDADPSFILVTGDLSNYGELASYRALKGLMDPVTLPVVYTLGNHDDPAHAAEGVLGRAGDDGPWDADQVIDGVHIIALDTSVPGRVGGALTEAQFDFLAEALGRSPDLPKLLMFHHPPTMDTDTPEFERLRTEDSQKLGEMIRGSGVRAILCGHIHQSRVTLWHGIPVVVTAGLHAAIDPLSPAGTQRFNSGATVAVCTLDDQVFSVNYVSLPVDVVDLLEITDAQIAEYEATLEDA